MPPEQSACMKSTDWHKAVDMKRRDSLRAVREAQAARDAAERAPVASPGPIGADELALIFGCCHPALDPEIRVALTLRSVCGLSTAEIAAAFLMSEPAMAQRIVRAKRKIRQAPIPLPVPQPEDLPRRLNAVLPVVSLVFTQGPRPARGPDLVRADPCDQATWLARPLAGGLPDEPEVTVLLPV